ncbi:hypothetical protein E2562_011559 [Oryza meyeriana var. granulata]|uniref:Uncharacterized protein n=1 Tax=Oryza meyeriana var. granulata TaxID=110450 RepID=A0A6G1DW44_9ORYZ|nr:hypothetical protein E2562_011559 [Oryza meyeriana var. granulata]
MGGGGGGEGDGSCRLIHRCLVVRINAFAFSSVLPPPWPCPPPLGAARSAPPAAVVSCAIASAFFSVLPPL